MEDLRDKLKAIRKQLGMKQYEFALFVGVPNDRISQYENKRRKISLKAQKKIIEACKQAGVEIKL